MRHVHPVDRFKTKLGVRLYSDRVSEHMNAPAMAIPLFVGVMHDRTNPLALVLEADQHTE